MTDSVSLRAKDLNDWSPVELGKIIQLKYGKGLKAADRMGGGIPVFGSGGVVGFHDAALVRGPGVVVGRKGNVGAAYWSEGDFYPIDTTYFVETQQDLRFIYYLLSTLTFENSHAAVPGLSRETAYAKAVLLPPLEQQRLISATLRIFDLLIENNRRRIELLEETARLLYQEWFVNFRYPGHEDVALVDSELGPIPEHWRVETLGDLAEVVKDTVDPASIPSGSPLVGLEHLPRRSTTLADWDLATEVGSRRATFREGDVLFGKIRPYFHKVVEAPFSGYCSTDAVVLRPLRDSDSAQVLAIASCDDFIAHASASANGTKMPRANMDVLMRYPVPRPTESIGQGFEEVAKPLTELAKQLIRTNSRLTEVRDLLLPRLVAGDLDISDLDLRLEAVG